MSGPLLLVDSSIWIRVKRTSAATELKLRLAAAAEENRIAFNDVVRMEVLVGARDARELAANTDQFLGLHRLALIEDTWDRATALGYELRRMGLPSQSTDLLIAASAIEHDAVLMHADRDFDRIAKHSALKVESFVDSLS